MINLQVYLEHYLEYYDEITEENLNLKDKSARFNVTFYEQIADLTMTDQLYTLSSGILEINVPDLELNPILHDDPETPEDGAEFIYEALIA